MNATVARIVEIMFQDTVMSDEVQAIKDEVMNNCQERFDDLVQRGMSEDDAISAVVESLKGMEDVIAEYPKKVCESSIPLDDAGDVDLTFAPQTVDRINVKLISDDVHLERSQDDMIHVTYDPEEMKNLKVNLVGRELKIEREPAVMTGDGVPDTSSLHGEKKAPAFFANIRKVLGDMTIRLSIGGDSDLTIAIPDGCPIGLKVNTTSGDVDVDGVNLEEIDIATINGDVDVEADGVQGQIRLKSTSGDIDLSAQADALKVETISGDLDIHGSYSRVNLHSTSGDMDVYARMQHVQVWSISGDINLTVEDDSLQDVASKTTSGDLAINLPVSLRGAVAVHMNTVSGDKYNRFGEPCGSVRATINAQSVSGDVSVR